ncbi:MAG: hypothetical protein IT269_02170 [Saprospiraceae bacterium]|nr:hypothetical protein [Saprospiraceae bacterium]
MKHVLFNIILTDRNLIYLYWLLFLGGSVLLVYRAYYFKLAENELVAYTCTLAEQPEIIPYTGRRKGHYLYLPIKEHPDINFDLHDWAFAATHARQFIREVHPLDTIIIWIHPTDYEKLCKPLDESVIFKKRPHVAIHQLNTIKQSGYMTLERFQDIYRRIHRWTLYIFVVFMVLLALYVRMAE